MGERIAQLRRMHGLSQAKLACALGLSTGTIAMYEQGGRRALGFCLNRPGGRPRRHNRLPAHRPAASIPNNR